MYAKPIANIIVKGGRLKAFPLRSRTRQKFPFSLLLFNTVLKVLARAIRQGKFKKKNNKQTTKLKMGKVKLSLLIDHMILLIEKFKEHTNTIGANKQI